jgi:hypothetical protein
VYHKIRLSHNFAAYRTHLSKGRNPSTAFVSAGCAICSKKCVARVISDPHSCDEGHGMRVGGKTMVALVDGVADFNQ